MKKALATNLRKVRSLHKQTQDTASRCLKISIHTYQSYEEGRAEPSAERLVQIAEHFEIINLRTFISDQDWDPANEYPKEKKISKESPLQANYRCLSHRDRGLVDIILGIRNIE